jgi:hypothetical protein
MGAKTVFASCWVNCKTCFAILVNARFANTYLAIRHELLASPNHIFYNGKRGQQIPFPCDPFVKQIRKA